MKRFAGFVLATSLAVVLFGDLRIAVFGFFSAIVSSLLLDPPAVRTALRAGVVLTLAFAAAVTSAVVAWASGPARGLETGGMILLRLIVLTLAAAVLSRSVDAETLRLAAQRIGFERLGLILGLALNSLPRVAEVGSDVWAVHRLRSKSLLDRLSRLPGLAEVLLAHTARIADEAAAAASLRGHSALILNTSELDLPVRTVVVTGPPNGGKTEAVATLAELLRSRGVTVVGFVQLGELQAGKKIAFRIRDLNTGDEGRLARLGELHEGEHGTRYRFFEEGFAVAQNALAKVKPGAVLIIDELGPVEVRGSGHMPALRSALATPDLGGMVVVVRRSLVPSLLASLGAEDAIIVDVEEAGEDVIDSILSALAVDV